METRKKINWQKVNQGTLTLEDFKRLDALDANAFWRIDAGHILNILEEAIEKINILEKHNDTKIHKPKKMNTHADD